MKIKAMFLFSLLAMVVYISACSNDVVSAPKFVFSSAPNQEAAFKFQGKVYTTKELTQGHENDIYELENKLYELKINRVKGLVLKNLIEADPRKGNLSEEQFVEKYIVSKVKVTEKEVQAFIKERKIPQQHINDQLKDRIQKFIIQGKTQELVDAWLDEKMSKSPVEVYFSQPLQPVFDVKVGDAPILGNKKCKNNPSGILGLSVSLLCEGF